MYGLTVRLDNNTKPTLTLVYPTPVPGAAVRLVLYAIRLVKSAPNINIGDITAIRASHDLQREITRAPERWRRKAVLRN